MQCDICGKETRVFLTEMEGAKLYVCIACNPKGEGKIERPKRDFNFKQKKPFVRFSEQKQEPFDLSSYDLLEDYADQIKKLRESKNKTYDEFAKDLYVTSSYLQKVEQGKLKPSAGLLLKLYEKHNLLLVNKVPGKEFPKKEKKEFRKPKPKFENRERREGQEKRDFKPREKEMRLTEPKQIYAPEENKGESFESVSHNNKKKLVL